MLLSGFVTATTTNVLTGSIFEFARRASRVSVAVYGDVALNLGNLFSFTVGDQVIALNAQVFSGALTTSGQAEHLRWPDDFLIQNEPVLAGERLILEIVRATGNLSWAVIMVPVV